MSLIAMQGGATGTGTVTLLAPVTNTDRTLTLPDATGTVVSTGSTAVVSQAMLAAGVAGNGPAFSAYQSSSQSPSSATWTKIQLQSEEFDTASCFDSTTNYRFTPTVAGYYQVNGALQNNSTATVAMAIYKNGSIFKQVNNQAVALYNSGFVSALIYMNGSTDYLELYCNLSAGGSLNSTAVTTYFQASMVRAA